jgi:hypothetical protein
MKTSQMMGWIENRPNKFLNQNFVRQGLPAKCKTRRFRLNSLILLIISVKTVELRLAARPCETRCETRPRDRGLVSQARSRETF